MSSGEIKKYPKEKHGECPSCGRPMYPDEATKVEMHRFMREHMENHVSDDREAKYKKERDNAPVGKF